MSRFELHQAVPTPKMTPAQFQALLENLIPAAGVAGDGLTVAANKLALALAATGGLEFAGGELRLKAGAAVPVGAEVLWPTDTPPSGWLEEDGSALSRTTYADLFAVLGVKYGAGDGSTTFNLPDFRGEFMRGWDHGRGADTAAAGRTNRGDGTTGDNVGTLQVDGIRDHAHLTAFGGSNSGSSLYMHRAADGTPFYGWVNVAGAGVALVNSTATGVTGPFALTDNELKNIGGGQTRPRNVFRMVIIKI